MTATTKRPTTLTLSPRACYILAAALEDIGDTLWGEFTEQQREDAQHIANILWSGADKFDAS
jgi:hypothetical protein